MRIVRQRPERRFRPAIDASVRLDQMHRVLESFARQLRKPGRHRRFLEGKIIYPIAGSMLPPPDPYPAEIAIPVKNHQRLRWRRGNLKIRFHRRVITRKAGATNSKGQTRYLGETIPKG